MNSAYLIVNCIQDKPRFLKTKFEGPKKEKKEKGKLNTNVQKFLAKKEAEERAKKIQESSSIQA